MIEVVRTPSCDSVATRPITITALRASEAKKICSVGSARFCRLNRPRKPRVSCAAHLASHRVIKRMTMATPRFTTKLPPVSTTLVQTAVLAATWVWAFSARLETAPGKPPVAAVKMSKQSSPAAPAPPAYAPGGRNGPAPPAVPGG